MLYILRSSEPIGSDKHKAQYYVGYADDDRFMRRIAAHQRGKGSAFTRAVVLQGLTLQVMAIIEGDRHDERAIKRQGRTPKIIDLLQRGKKPSCIKGNVLFVQAKNWLETSCYDMPIFAFEAITQ